MAAPLKRWTIGEVPRIIKVLGKGQGRCTSLRRCHLTKCPNRVKEISNNDNSLIKNSVIGLNTRRYHHVSCVLSNRLIWERTCLQTASNRSSTFNANGFKLLKTSSAHSNWPDDQSHQRGEQPERNILKLMNFPLRMLPNPLKAIRNVIMEFLVRRMDQDFSKSDFLEGAQQALIAVSSLISRGNFDDLYGLVDAGAVQEIRENYSRLDAVQRQMIHIDPENIQARFIYEIGMMWDEMPEKKVEVEVTTVFHCVPVTPLEMDKYQVCNYRFIRQYSETLEPLSDWTINRLNHFLLNDITDK